MKFFGYAIRPFAMVAFLVFLGGTATLQAQEITESHQKAARAAIKAIGATDDFDVILSNVASELKVQLYQKNPDLQPMISVIVDETAIAMASRRADLERESALVYARVFSEAELKQIADFYTSATGKKLISDGPIVTRELLKGAEIWQAGIARDLAVEVGKKIGEEVAKTKTEGGQSSKSE